MTIELSVRPSKSRDHLVALLGDYVRHPLDDPESVERAQKICAFMFEIEPNDTGKDPELYRTALFISIGIIVSLTPPDNVTGPIDGHMTALEHALIKYRLN